MPEHAHQGTLAPGPLVQPVDRRVSALDSTLRLVETLAGAVPLIGAMRDAGRAGQMAWSRLGIDPRFAVGVVIHALPRLNWYRVQTAECGNLAALKLEHSPLVPLGPRDSGPVPPQSAVLLLMPRGLNHAYILGVLPPVLPAGAPFCADWVVQGGGSGPDREACHYYLQSLYGGGGVVDWSAGRPRDETTFQRGWVTPTGLALTVDDALIQVRVNEACGLFMTLWDSWLRLAGVHLRLESGVHEEVGADDEGEAHHFRGVAAYPWEALGLPEPGTPFTVENDGQDVQDGHEAGVDLEDQDARPIYRYTEYGGYLGQGHLRAVSNALGTGLWREAVGLDGSYSLVSAKRLHIGKRCLVTVPRAVHPPEDGRGDDARNSAYKFSGLFGSGPDHRIADFPSCASGRSLCSVAAVQDLLAYVANWQPLHPFHYHEKDFATPQESAAGLRAQDSLDFSGLATGGGVGDPEPVLLRVDHRYGDVAFFEREAFLVFHDDGSVQLGCGHGAQLLLAGGRARLEAPGGVELLAGTDVVVRGQQVVVEAEGSLDLSAANGDLRAKAERNMQLLAGNSGGGGLLLESRGVGTAQDYAGKFGEEVEAAGIVLRASNSVCALLGQDIYLRTGGDSLGEGDIVLDASMGKRGCFVYAQDVAVFTSGAVRFAFGPVDAVSDVSAVYLFSAQLMVTPGDVLAGGDLVGYGESSGLVLNGSVEVGGSVICGGMMADAAGVVGKVDPFYTSKLHDSITQSTQQIAKLAGAATALHQGLVNVYYAAGGMGDDATIGLLAFGYRDGPGRDQYGTADLLFPEARWMMLARFGMATGGRPWRENPVRYQGEDTYPWPGRRKWAEDAALLRLEALDLFDQAAGVARDRPGPYEDYEGPALGVVPMAEGYTVNR